MDYVFLDHSLVTAKGLGEFNKAMSHMPCRATQDGWVTVKSSDKTGPTGGGRGNPLQYSCHENPLVVVVVYLLSRVRLLRPHGP